MVELRSSLKHAAEFGLTAFGATRLARARHKAHTLVLAYHNVVPEGEAARGDTSLHLPQRDFSQQLDLLQRTHHVIPLTDLATAHKTAKPRAIITFDDAYAGALEAGVAELQKRSLPATVFVTPAFVGGAAFWWDRFARPAGEGLTPAIRDQALTRLAGRDGAISAWAASAQQPELNIPQHQRGASESALERAAATGLITYGSHTWSHPNLAELPESEVTSEITRPMAWLHTRFPQTVPYLAYPYGLSNANVNAAAHRAGYHGAFLISGGWITGSELTASPYELPRWNVPAGISLRGFEIRTAGAL